LVEGTTYAIEIISVEKTDAFNIALSHYVAEPGNDFLETRLRFFKQGVPVWDDQELFELSVVDATGQVYRAEGQTALQGSAAGGGFTPDHFAVWFTVPENSADFMLKYRDLSLIDLGP
jgi:hypothetical protein